MPPLLLDSQRLPIFLYLPNLIGYLRVGAFAYAVLQPDPGGVPAMRALVLSLALDYMDGPAARKFAMCTQFGDLLDHYCDHLSMFWLVYITSSSPLNVVVNFAHMAMAVVYMTCATYLPWPLSLQHFSFTPPCLCEASLCA